jgi:ubiquinone/menaquinone biosynthesis C-methylase UbiE
VISVLIFFLKKEKSKIVFSKLIQTRIFASVKDRLAGSLDSFYEDIPKFKDVILPFLLSLAGWIFRFTELYLISKLFSIDVPFIYFILIIAVANVIASMPISIYGLGTRDASLITMFLAFGIIPEKIISLSLFWFAVIWLTPSIFGAFVTFYETKKLGKFLLDYETASRFSKYMKKYPELYQNLTKIVKKNIPKKVSKPFIVDLGAGPGLLSLEIKRQIPNAKIIGVDPSDKMLKIAKENVKTVSFQEMLGTSEKIPLKSNSADIVVSRFSLTYWDNPRDSFTEINRVLISDGKVIIEALNRDFSRLKLFFIKIRMFFNLASLDVIKYHVDAYKTAYSIESVKKLLKDSNFKILKIEGTKKDWKFIVIAQKK